MKFLLPLFLMPFLCVKCCPWDDCEGADIVCQELLPILPQLENAIPYEDGETLNFRFADEPEVIRIDAFRRDNTAGASQNCQDGVFAVLQTTATNRPFRITLATDLFDREILFFNFFFEDSAQGDTEEFGVFYDEAERPGVAAPDLLRFITDTTLAGVNYQDVAEVKIMDGLATGEISAFYYSRIDGLLRVERVERPAFFRVE